MAALPALFLGRAIAYGAVLMDLPSRPDHILRMITRRTLLLAAALAPVAAIGLAGPVRAAAPAPHLTAAQQADVRQVEDYLNSVKTLKANFLQVNDDGSIAQGVFYLSRPGRMRLNYTTPNKNFVVADGVFVYYWDDQLKQQTNAPIGSTLADIILRDHLKLAGDVTVTKVEHADGVIRVTVVETKDPAKGSITLIFEDHPLSLRKWRVVDGQGSVTEVSLENVETGIKLASNLFYYFPPKDANRPAR